ncbi:MAG: glycosyltransferase family 2 protein, partial [Planctomycetes bacterium]|nr:glycosyltransferase family 2 protein [Planctomycetota bacterium]
RYVPVPNGGAGRARNIGIDHAKGDLVAFLDSDDEWFPGKLAMQRELMKARPDVLFSFSNFSVTLKSGEAVPHYASQWLTEPLAPRSWDEVVGPARAFSSLAPLPPPVEDVAVHIGDMSRALMLDNYVLTSSLVVRRQEAGDALRFAEDLPIFEDLYCFARLSLRGPAAYLDCDTAWQHGLAEGRVSDAGTLQRARAWDVLRERIWSRDHAFCSRHGELLEQRTEKNRLNLVRGLIGAGQSRQAREVLAHCTDAPFSYRLLAQTPDTLLRGLSAVRRRWMPIA